MAIEGGCRCGATRYTIAADRIDAIYSCHCTDCQRWSGSAFSEQAVVPEGTISATGPLIEFTLTTPSGAQSRQRACGVCHTRLWNTNSSRPGIVTVRAGTLDHNRTLAPRAHIWVKSKQPWVVLTDDVPTFEETPSMAEFSAALTR
ncbi:MAG: GFA family protein [Sphingomonas sp.]|uniref:GFA family protein n=1 Tax=Sphingomonas sp. TaxID=28214 RepID=UPI001AC9F403|nr:GFA family protein [Sphingomonas sp.]MBN8814627.1 GFA family protein [Sphingomonas sp.]